jgi:hypothetical protein
MKARTLLGWARGKGRCGDETGIWHAVIAEGETTRAACGRSQRVSGQVEPLPQDARACQRVGCDNARRGWGIK